MLFLGSPNYHRVWFRIASTLLLVSFLLNLLVCPHSKVEESFLLQATHDLFYHGIGPAIRHSILGQANITLPYDHLQYPGGERNTVGASKGEPADSKTFDSHDAVFCFVPFSRSSNIHRAIYLGYHVPYLSLSIISFL
jgi:hypothetical protein